MWYDKLLIFKVFLNDRLMRSAGHCSKARAKNLPLLQNRGLIVASAGLSTLGGGPILGSKFAGHVGWGAICGAAMGGLGGLASGGDLNSGLTGLYKGSIFGGAVGALSGGIRWYTWDR